MSRRASARKDEGAVIILVLIHYNGCKKRKGGSKVLKVLNNDNAEQNANV